jgi:hypothetical protein
MLTTLLNTSSQRLTKGNVSFVYERKSSAQEPTLYVVDCTTPEIH